MKYIIQRGLEYTTAYVIPKGLNLYAETPILRNKKTFTSWQLEKEKKEKLNNTEK